MPSVRKLAFGSVAALVVAAVLWWAVGWAAAIAFAVLVGGAAGGWIAWRRRQNRRAEAVAALQTAVDSGTPAPVASASDPPQLVEQLLGQGRVCLLLRKQIVGNLTPQQRAETRRRLYDAMTVLPEGEVRLVSRESNEYDEFCNPAPAASHEDRIVRVGCALLDRWCVTNEEYQRFVDGGGYENMALWDPEIWPGVLDFVDQSRNAGPRFWMNGRFSPGAERHPVVGVCWYEAQAYARWVGKRLPSESEWVKAAAWPTTMAASGAHQRRFPWGDEMDLSRANLWGSGRNGLAPVDDFPTGASVGGCQQMIGNVWEWTTSEFVPCDVDGRPLSTPGPMKNLRGGAYDTYFEHQASCNFPSGDLASARKPNLGFRCAVSVVDLSLDEAPVAAEPSLQEASA